MSKTKKPTVPFRLTQAQRRAVARLLPDLRPRLLLDQANQRVVKLTLDQIESIAKTCHQAIRSQEAWVDDQQVPCGRDPMAPVLLLRTVRAWDYRLQSDMELQALRVMFRWDVPRFWARPFLLSVQAILICLGVAPVLRLHPDLQNCKAEVIRSTVWEQLVVKRSRVEPFAMPYAPPRVDGVNSTVMNSTVTVSAKEQETPQWSV